MSQEYKIFYDERVIILNAKITKSFEKNEGLFFKYPKKEEIPEIIDAFVNFRLINKLYLLADNADNLLEQLKSCYTTIEAAGGVVKRNDGKLLAILRHGKWDLPKGKVEKGEFYKQTAIREVQEECGLQGIELGKRIADTYHIYLQNNQPILKRTIWYEMLLVADETPVPQTEEGITDIKWFDYKTIGEVMKNTYGSLKDIFVSQINPNSV
jgi:8-oxo-dGTP pyrophosphatase MutT (NUDIX family)